MTVEESKTVLVVEDDPDILYLEAAALERRGYIVRKASNGCDGLDVIKSGLPDLILLDLNMPVMDGRSFVRELHALHNSSSPPIILVTAEPNALAIADQMGAVAVVPKPFDIGALVGAVAHHCGGAQKVEATAGRKT